MPPDNGRNTVRPIDVKLVEHQAPPRTQRTPGTVLGNAELGTPEGELVEEEGLRKKCSASGANTHRAFAARLYHLAVGIAVIERALTNTTRSIHTRTKSYWEQARS